MSRHSNLYVGVDVGSGSVRAGLFNSTGQLLNSSVLPIQTHNPEPEFFEQSSDDIWTCVCATVKNIVKDVKNIADIKGLSFCATCSLVAIGHDEGPISVSKTGDAKWNIVMWMDHRASVEADSINATCHPVLNFVGGKISLEMQTPKLLWLKKHLPANYGATKLYFDLGDYLRWKATGGCAHRSICCIVCKWTFVNAPAEPTDTLPSGGWDASYFERIGLSDVLTKISSDDYSYPADAQPMAPFIARELGLSTAAHVQVGFSMIDAHSGVLGMLGCKEPTAKDEFDLDMTSRLGIVCGTSNCHMALNRRSLSIPGLWGPYYGVIFEDYYLTEGGQSAAGSLLDHVVKSHVAYSELAVECGNSHGAVLAKLESILRAMKVDDVDTFCKLTRTLHIWPDFHGNRSPIADPSLEGMMSGLTLSTTKEDLAVRYLATIQALAYASRHIKDSMETAGHSFQQLVLCGGLVKSQLFLQLHADIIGCPVLVPECPEPVLLGAAMSAAAAVETSNGTGRSLEQVVQKMAGGCSATFQPNPLLKEFHGKKYKVFLKMLADQLEYRRMMQ